MIVEHQDFRELALRPHRVHFKLAEPAAKRDVLLGGQELVAHRQHLVLDQRGFERGKRVVVHRRLEVDT